MGHFSIKNKLNTLSLNGENMRVFFINHDDFTEFK